MSCVKLTGVFFFVVGLSKIILVTVCADASAKQREKGCDIARDERNWRNNAHNCEENKFRMKEQDLSPKCHGLVYVIAFFSSSLVNIHLNLESGRSC
jgi:hypothetical protein